jgi:hypothetical protein
VTVISGKKISYTLFLGCAQVEVHLWVIYDIPCSLHDVAFYIQLLAEALYFFLSVLFILLHEGKLKHYVQDTQKALAMSGYFSIGFPIPGNKFSSDHLCSGHYVLENIAR